MDEVERRIVAHDMALIEVAAHVDRARLDAAMQSIRAGFVVGITEEERVIRIAAIELLEEAMRPEGRGAMEILLQSRRLR